MKNLREEAGLNCREFFDYMGIPLRTLEEWESGRRKMLTRMLDIKYLCPVINKGECTEKTKV